MSALQAKIDAEQEPPESAKESPEESEDEIGLGDSMIKLREISRFARS
jgi:hypothetical protein